MAQRSKKLLEQVGDAIRLKHYAYGTERTYVYWAKRYVLYHTTTRHLCSKKLYHSSGYVSKSTQAQHPL